MYFRGIVLAFIVAAGQGCEKPKPSLGCKDPDGDFLFKDCLCDQVQNPELFGISLKKKVRMNGKEEEKVITELDSLGWEKELALFFSSDIKKSTAEKFYTYERVLPGAGGSVSHEEYRLKPEERGDVEYIRISKSNGRIDSVEVQTKADNYIYKGAKLLKFRLSYASGQPILSAYEVAAGQKVITKDSSEFYVLGEVLERKKKDK